MKKIEFYFDFLSPFSYFAWINHQQELLDYELQWEYMPVLMGRLFSHHKFPGPGQIQAKRNYELKKCFRYAQRHQIAFNPPKTFPFNPLAIIRLATMHANTDISEQRRVIDFIFSQVWGNGMVLEDPELILSVFQKHSLSSEVIEKSFSKEAKLELKNNMKTAIAKQIFGVPSFAIGNEFFWGNDSFTDLRQYLNGNDIWNKELYNEVLNNNLL